VDLLLQACEAIGEAHALGIVHRDLKPANLFLTHRVDGTPSVKVLDFGISKMPAGTRRSPGSALCPTLASTVMGSPQYMSPEQMVSAAAADQRSDIWSLGAILYELLTGRLAFDGSSIAQVCARVLEAAPVPLTHFRLDVPNEIGIVISRCLARDLSQRYDNVAELARALAPFGTTSARASADSIARIVEGGIEGRAPSPAATFRPTAAEILAPPPRRRRRVSGYVGASLLLLSILGSIGGGLARHARSLRVAQPTAAAAAFAGAVPAPMPSLPLASPPAPAGTRGAPDAGAYRSPR
jgi:serine/threonine-protein kinase